jgi:hypothetical protein
MLRLTAVIIVAATAAGCSGGPCRDPLLAGRCAPTFAEQQQRWWPWPSNGRFARCAHAGRCGEYQVWASPPDFSSLSCVYDLGGNLVLATSCSDIRQYCGGDAFCVSSGPEIDTGKLCRFLELPKSCAPGVTDER